MRKEELVGKLLSDVEADPQQARFYVEVCRRVIAAGRPVLTDNLPLRMRDGTTRYLRQYDVPFRDPVTGETLLFGLSRDVTVERELIEERVRRERAEREMEIATEIQRSILPGANLTVPGYEVAGASVPSRYAAGDFYDWWVPPGGQPTICIGDVTGHGIGPAILAAACKAYSRCMFGQSASLLGGMTALNRSMCAEVSSGRFVTLAALQLSPADRSVALLSAGHGPVLHYAAATRTVTTLDTHGLPLAVDRDTPYDDPTIVPLDEGDLILLLSDGLIESQSSMGEMYGLDRLKAQITRLAGVPLDEMIRSLVATSTSFAGAGAENDDMTLVVIRRGRR